MLSFFRRMVNSRTGVIVTFIVLGLIALAFAAGAGMVGGAMNALAGGGTFATLPALLAAGMPVAPGEARVRRRRRHDGGDDDVVEGEIID